jgi:uncharacterized protein (TIGR02246 family)
MDARSLQVMSALAVSLAVAACSGSAGSATDTTKAPPGAATPANDAAVHAMIDSADRKFEAAFKAGDAAAAASFYEDNATSMPPNMEPESGRAAIEKGYADLFKTVGKVTDFTAQVKDVDVYADHAIEIGSYAMTFTPAGAKDAMKDHGSYVNYWRKQPDGSWKLHRDAIVSAMPMPNAGPAPAATKKK